MHFAGGGGASPTDQAPLTAWERDVVQYAEEGRKDAASALSETWAAKTRSLRELCAKPVAQVQALRSAAAKCEIGERELDAALRFLHEAGAILLHAGGDGGMAEGRVFMQPQWIVDALSYVVREADAKNVNDDLRAMDVKIREETMYGGALDNLLTKGVLSGSLLRECLWGLPVFTSGERKFENNCHKELIELLEDFKLLRSVGKDRFLVPAMLPEGDLPPGYDISQSWVPEASNGALQKYRRRFRMQALPGAFFSQLLLSWSIGGVDVPGQTVQQFLKQHVATFACRTATILRRPEQHDDEPGVEETVVVSCCSERKAEHRLSEIRVMAWVDFGSDSDKCSGGETSTSWGLFREVCSTIEGSALSCGPVDCRVPIVDEVSGEEIAGIDIYDQQLKGLRVRIDGSGSFPGIDRERKDLMPPDEGKRAMLNRVAPVAPQLCVGSAGGLSGAREGGSGKLGKIVVYCAQAFRTQEQNRNLADRDIDVHAEAQRLLVEHKKSGIYDVEIHPQPTFSDFLDTMLAAGKTDVRILHFMGHGNSHGDLFWVKDGESRQSVRLSLSLHTESLELALKQSVQGRTLELCVLNSCSSLELGTKLREIGLKNAVCWEGDLDDHVAREFTKRFYSCLLSAHPGDYRTAFKAASLEVVNPQL